VLFKHQFWRTIKIAIMETLLSVNAEILVLQYGTVTQTCLTRSLQKAVTMVYLSTWSVYNY
jgi:hypothetical protein